MRRSGSEKLEMIRLVEQSDLPVRSTLRQLGIAPSSDPSKIGHQYRDVFSER